MGKRILLVTGSPRKGGNSDHLADAFTKGAQAAGHTVDRFEAAHHEIGGCKACDTCWSKGVPCSYNDAFNTGFAPLLEQADVLVLCTPLYFYGWPAQIKAPLDKMYAYAGEKSLRRPHLTESAFIICGEEKTEAPYGGAVESYRQVSRYCGWKDRGVLVATGVWNKGDVDGTDFLARAEALGRSI